MTAMPPARIKVGNRWIGTGEPCYVIAEAGSNHNGSLDQALALIDVASDAGADALPEDGGEVPVPQGRAPDLRHHRGDGDAGGVGADPR